MDGPKETLDRRYHIAYLFYENLRYGQCADLLEELLADQPNHPDARGLLALSYIYTGRIPESIELSRDLISENTPNAFATIGEAYLRRYQIPEAMFYARKALEHEPFHMQAILVLLEALGEDGDSNGCKELLFQAMKTWPGNFGLLYRGYMAFNELDEGTANERYFIRLMEQTGERTAFVRFCRGLTAEKEGALHEAWEFYRQALVLDPNVAAFRQHIRQLELRHPQVAEGGALASE